MRRRPVIPLRYRLREGVRVEPGPGGSWRVVCASPLTVLEVNPAAARLLERSRGGASVGVLAAETGSAEEKVFGLCERLRARGVLAVEAAVADPGFTPTVTVIVPTRNRAGELAECLDALARVEYPSDRLQLMVVDDGSEERSAALIAETASRHGGRLLVNRRTCGPACSRNRAARLATGEILAFVDSDCLPGPVWLRDLIPYFAWGRVGAVGGRTVGFSSQSALDRYEEVASPLDMGRHPVMQAEGPDTFYVPTCNLLVRERTYRELGGLREDLQVGEDVDFCWRLRAAGHLLVYSPTGTVRHKHRQTPAAMLCRRADYGTSEATLYALHRDKRKRFPASPAPLATTLLATLAVARGRLGMAAVLPAPLLWDGGRRVLRLRRSGVEMPGGTVVASVARGHLSMLYFAHFHLVRYYLGALVATGARIPAARRVAVFAVLYAGTTDYFTRRPRLSYPVYLGYYLAEHLAYQAGVIAGCLRARTLRSYFLALGDGRPSA